MFLMFFRQIFVLLLTFGFGFREADSGSPNGSTLTGHFSGLVRNNRGSSSLSRYKRYRRNRNRSKTKPKRNNTSTQTVKEAHNYQLEIPSKPLEVEYL